MLVPQVRAPVVARQPGIFRKVAHIRRIGATNFSGTVYLYQFFVERDGVYLKPLFFSVPLIDIPFAD